MQSPADKSSLERLELLYSLSQTFNSTLVLDDVLDCIMDEVILVMNAERGFVVLHSDDGELEFKAARGLDHTTISQPEFQVSQSIVEGVVHSGEPVITSDAQLDQRFSERQSIMFLGLRSVLCVPLRIQDRILGAIYVDNRFQAGIFTDSDLDLLTAIAASATVAIENASLHKVALEKARMERELQVARQMQASLLPHALPELPGWDFSARWLPAREVAGDYYDFFSVHRRADSPPDLAVVLADVADKGMPAALFMTLTRSTMRASLDEAPHPAVGIRHANQLITNDSIHAMFVTLIYAELQPQTGDLVYVNAGHNPPLFYQAAGRTLTTLPRTGMALGVDDSVEFQQAVVRFDPGDFLLLFTDGVPDALDRQQQSFGMERIEDLLLASAGQPAETILTRLESALRAFAGDSPPFDDITMVLIKRLG